MRKIVLLLSTFLLFSSTCFGEMIDKSYIDLIFDNFDDYSEVEKKENTEILDVLISSNIGLELLYSEIIRSKSDALKARGISNEELRKNIDILKEWSVEDRKNMLNAGVEGDMETVYMINDKNAKQDTSIFIQSKKTVISTYKDTFQDTKQHWSKPQIDFLASRGIISGKSETSYAPDESIRLSEISALVVNLIVDNKSDIPNYDGAIKDINQGEWYDEVMQHAVVIGLVKDDGNNLYPNQYTTREKVIDIIVRSLKAMGYVISQDDKSYKGGFTDIQDISLEYRDSVITAINLGLISGMGDGRIAPGESITRGQTAAVVKNLYDYILQNMILADEGSK